MTPATGTESTQAEARAPARGARRDLAAALPVVAVGAGATWWLLGLTASYAAATLLLYVGLAALLLRSLPESLPGPGLGPANRVTLLRAALALPLGGLALLGAGLNVAGAWWVIAVATAVLVLDGVDGRVARRTGTATPFGARFDMELDAALILALSVLVWRDGRAGVWVLSIGLLRYLFVVAGWVVPALTAELPPSARRKAVCVVQGVVLLVALGPIIPQPMATAVLAGGLASLLYSFAADARWALANG